MVDFAQFGPIEIKPLSRIQRDFRIASAGELDQSAACDAARGCGYHRSRGGRATALKSKASQEGVRLTPLAFIVRACLLALQEFPRFNASLDAGGENLVFKKYFNIGFAADTPNGLVVPVIANADRLSIYDDRARAGDDVGKGA